MASVVSNTVGPPTFNFSPAAGAFAVAADWLRERFLWNHVLLGHAGDDLGTRRRIDLFLAKVGKVGEIVVDQATGEIVSHTPVEILWSRILDENPIGTLSDSEVIALSESQMDSELLEQWSELNFLNQNNELDEEDKKRLDELLHLYELGTLHKAQALAEAVRRGLREPLTP